MDMVYAYLREQFKQSGNGLIQLILIHVLIFLLLFLFGIGYYICGYKDYSSWLYMHLALPSLYPFVLERPWTMITYSFVHKGFLDLFWDMFILYMFAQRIRAITRSKHILRLYCLGQIMGAITFYMLYQFSPPFQGIATHLIGPSASIYAIMIAVCVMMPSLKLYCFFFSLPLRYVALVLLLIALGHLPTQDTGHYLAQLAGALAGYVYAKFCKNDMDINPSFFSGQRVTKTHMSISINKKMA